MRWSRVQRVRAYRVWVPTVCTGLGVLMLAAFPSLLVPVAREFQALCAQYPPLAALTLHVPPIPLSLLLLLLVLALGNGLRVAAVRGVGAVRFNCALPWQAAPIPVRLKTAAAVFGLNDRLTYLDHRNPAAFCYGFLRPRIALTSGLLDRLEDEALAAVLAHERHHLLRRDPLRYLTIEILAATAFMLPLTRHLRQLIEARVELQADRAALAVAPRSALAAALLAVLNVHTMQRPGSVALTATEARIAHLAGQPVLPTIPRVTWIVTTGFLAIVVTAVAELFSSAHLVMMVCDLCPVAI
jgi:hypothetical protein